MTKQTTTPWACQQVGNNIDIVDTAGRVVAEVHLRAPDARSREEAQLIVRAVNAHDDLVAALRGLVLEIEDRESSEQRMFMFCEEVADQLAKARAVLARAKGEE